MVDSLHTLIAYSDRGCRANRFHYTATGPKTRDVSILGELHSVLALIVVLSGSGGGSGGGSGDSASNCGQR